MTKLAGKIAIVTGSSSGNGRAIAIALAGEGSTVVCSDISKSARAGGYEEDIRQDTDDVIRNSGGTAEYMMADVGKFDDMKKLMESVIEKYGRLDIMVNNAGIFTGLHTIVDETEEQFDKTHLINGKSVWIGCKLSIAQMLKQEPVDGSRGRIVNIASIGGLVGLAQEPAYCFSKGAVVNLTRQLAVDYSSERINVNAICPGFLHTAMVRPFIDDTDLNAALHAKSPWPDLGYAEDVAKAAVFLASSDAAWCSGSLLTVDGGYTSQ